MFEYGEDRTYQILSYLDMVLERNKQINLTAVRDMDDAIAKHIADSLSITKLDHYKNAQKIIDVGTGAGFPGVILAAASPEKHFVLLDSTLKRLKVIDEFVDKLSINNVETLHSRAEEIVKKPEYSEKFDLCVSRAVANLSTLSEWCLPFVRKNGHFISYKGENYEEELQKALPIIEKLGAKVEKIEKADSEFEEISGHVLIIIEKQ